MCRHEQNQICEIMGFVRIFWKKNFQDSYLPKTSIVDQIVCEILAQVMLWWLHTNPSEFNFYDVITLELSRVPNVFSQRENRLTALSKR